MTFNVEEKHFNSVDFLTKFRYIYSIANIIRSVHASPLSWRPLFLLFLLQYPTEIVWFGWKPMWKIHISCRLALIYWRFSVICLLFVAYQMFCLFRSFRLFRLFCLLHIHYNQGKRLKLSKSVSDSAESLHQIQRNRLIGILTSI